MRYAINTNSVVPIRAEASERSEMISQLLFGEHCKILESKDSFAKIKNHFDQYIGWVDQKCLVVINKNDYTSLCENIICCTNTPLVDSFCITDNSSYKLSAGSILPFYNPIDNTFKIDKKEFMIYRSVVNILNKKNKDLIISSAKMFLNTPYLWGGKNALGIDCSGLVQMAFLIAGYKLTRDTSTQIDEGTPIKSLDLLEPTDLIFFHKNNKVVHVGVYIGNRQIIHASGKVRIDNIDENGILNIDTNQYTHQIFAFRRII